VQIANFCALTITSSLCVLSKERAITPEPAQCRHSAGDLLQPDRKSQVCFIAIYHATALRMGTWSSNWGLSAMKETSLKARSGTCPLPDIYYCPFTIIDHHQTPFKFLKTINRLRGEWVLWPFPLSRSCLLQQPSFSLQNSGQRRYQRGSYVWRRTLEE
jgi:hypothetical protein